MKTTSNRTPTTSLRRIENTANALEQHFQRADQNGDGTLTRGEARSAWIPLWARSIFVDQLDTPGTRGRLTEADVDRWLDDTVEGLDLADQNRDGFVDANESLGTTSQSQRAVWAAAVSHGGHEESLRATAVTKTQLRSVGARLADETAAADADGDGVLTEAEIRGAAISPSTRHFLLDQMQGPSRGQPLSVAGVTSSIDAAMAELDAAGRSRNVGQAAALGTSPVARAIFMLATSVPPSPPRSR